MKNNHAAYHVRSRGVVLIWVALLLLIFVGLVVLALDVGVVMLAGHRLQNAADSAALAATWRVRIDQADARTQAQTIGLLNDAANQAVQLNLNSGNAGGGDIVLGRFNRGTGIFTPTTNFPTAVQVNARRTSASAGGPVGLFFGNIFGLNAADVERQSIAMVGGGTGAGLITLSPSQSCSLNVSGNPILQVDGGDIQVNSSAARGACLQGNAVIDAPNMNVVGDPGFHQTGQGGSFTGQVNPNSDPIPDPLGHLPPPPYDVANPQIPGTITDSGIYQAGYYPGGIDLQAQADVTLEPGIYILDGIGLDIRGGGNFTALEVMFYVINTGHIYIGGTGDVTITPIPLDAASIYAGVSIFQARGNTNESTIIGTGLMDLQGTLYFPDAHLRVGGTGDGFGNQLIADTVEVFGDGIKTIIYNGPVPAVGNRVFLVE